MNNLLKPILVGCVVFLLWPIWGHAQSLNLTAPNGGEVWLGGTTHTISWTYTNVDNIKIEYSLNNGLNWTLIIASYPTSALTYTWTVPCIGSNQVKVRITNTLQFTQDESNGVFTIPEPTVDITYPAGGEEFQTGTGQYITWQTTGVVTLALQYSSNGGSSWTSIGNVPATNGYANWIAPSSATSNLRVRAYNIESFTNRDSTLAPLAIVTSPTINNAKYFGGPYDGYDMSSSPPDSIRIVAPNGGEVYNPTSTTQIQWNFCDVNRVKIEYSIDNGAAWTLIATDLPADQLSYTWTIPNSPSNQCLVKVTGIDRNVFDVSDGVFTISSAFVQLVYPNGGESFGNSTGQYIEWDYNSVSTVKLEYSTNNGSSWTLIGTAPAANKYANWIAPASSSNQCLIRISDNTVSALSDQSESSFAIVQLPVLNNAKYFGGPYDGYSMNSSVTDSIKVTSPNGGEIWTSASTRTITWTYKDVDNVIIEYSLDDGQSWIQLAQNIPASQLSYNWTIPTTPSYTCRVRVRDMIRDISDMSDQVFIIPNAYVEITYPNGGENYSTGSGQYIEWNYADLATIKLEYSTDNGNTWLVIGTAPAANKYANWVAPSSASTQMLIRATDNSNPIYSDVSNAVFRTNTSPTLNNAKYFGGQFDGYSMYAFKDVYVKVIKPNGGEIWGNGTTQQIRWATLNTNENLKVEYSIDNEQNWTTLLNDVPNSPVTYDWEIASPPSTICKVRATTMSGEVVDKSDDFFTIANPSGILTNPISGNQFCSGESTVVTYSSGLTFNPGNRFIVQLSDSVGTFSGSLINIGEVTSTIPVPITVTFPVRYYTSSLYRLRVIATNTPTLGTNNGTNFTINPLPLVNLGPDRSICAGTSTVLNAMNSNSTYVWSTGATSSSISASTAGTYSVQVTNACGTSRDTIQIGVINTPTVYLGPDTLICQNSVLQLRADSADVSYLWSTGSTSQSINVVVPGTYSVTVSNTCGAATDLITIGNLAPIQVNLGPDRGICSGESVTLNAGTSNASYSWSTGANTPSITVSNPGTYSVNVNNGCGIVSDQITLFNGAFQVNAGIDRTICNGESVQLTATGANAYSWNTGQTTSSITVSPTTTTTYTVSATNIYNCTSTDAVVVNVNALPVATSALNGPVTYCANQPSVLQANAGIGLSYQWQLNGDNVSGATAATFSPTATGNYAVRVTNAQNCSATSAQQAITVLTVPSASITPSGNVNVCSGSSVSLQANTGDGLLYAWNRAGSTLSGANTSSLLATQGGSYTVQVTAANGCFATSAATQITVNETPTISIAADGPVSFCAGGSVQLTATASNGSTIQWEKDGVALSGATGAAFTATAAGIYSARATSASNCSSNSGAIVVTVSPIENVSQNESTCGSYTWAVNGTTYNSSGQYTATVGCANYTLNLTISGGTTCDDNDPCTVNDVILSDCSCEGTFADADNDGTCDANDLCVGPEPGTRCDDNDPCTIEDVILDDCTCAGTFADADNDGTCDANDNCAGPEAGAACDDNDPCTVNDVILGDCSCAGTFADADSDGTCDANDNCAGPEAGAACNDNDPCTVSDIILADCSCAGTFADADNDGTCDANDNCAGPEAGASCDDNDPCTINDIILADCSCAGTFADADSDGTCDANDLCAGPEAGAACDDNNPCTVGDVILADCSCAGTFADADNDGTCDANDNCLGQEAGTACDDNNPCTVNDIILADCSCAGTFADADNDGTCDATDNCAGPEAGAACDDNDPCTVNDIILADCSCAGTFADADNDGTCDANDLCDGAEPGTACDDNDPCTVSDVILADCSCAGTFADADSDGTCDANDLCAGPEAGAVCDDNNPCTVGDVILTDCSCTGTFADADNDGACDANDNCAGPEAGASCDDNDPCTVGDVILADCSCAGSFADADNDGTCDANDLCTGAEPGAACDDNDPCTVNDIILADCSCAGTFADADSDGTCDANDLCAGAEPATACDDNDPCTTGDVILADCSCAGTFADADNDGTCDANDLCAGAEPGTTCDDSDPCTVGDIILADCSCAGTFADSDSDGTCDANDLCAGAEPGTACDDSDPCTTGDIILADCSCAGTFADADFDGTCDANDLCSEGPEPGSECNDRDDCTVDDMIQADCSCAGIYLDSDADGTCDAFDICADGPEPGMTCDDGTPCTINDTVDENCICRGTLVETAVSTTAAHACGPYTWNGQTYSVSGNYSFITQTVLGCDSIAQLALTVGTPTFSSESMTACGSYAWNGTTYSQSGTYTYVTTNSTGCPNTATLNLTINTLSVAPTGASASQNTVSAGTQVTLSVQGGSLGTGASWKWYRSACGGTLIGTGSSITVTANVTNSYFVRAEGTCNTTACASVTVNVLTTACGPQNVTASATTICAGSSTTLTVTGSTGTGGTWRWYRNGCGSGTCIGTGASITVSPTSNTTYFVRSEGGSCGTTSCRSIAIVVNTLPAKPSNINGITSGLCSMQNVTYTTSNCAGATSYQWTVPSGVTIVSGQGTASITVNFSTTLGNNSSCGSPAICVRSGNSCGWSSYYCKDVQLAPSTPGSISGSSTPCRNQPNVYSISSVAGATSYQWTVPNGYTIQSGQGTTSITVVAGGTSGSIGVRAVNACGTSSMATRSVRPKSCFSSMPMTFDLWPNPTSERVFFAYEEEQPELMEIYDMMGRTIYSGSWLGEFDVTSLAGGIYFVRASSGGESVVKRMEVVR